MLIKETGIIHCSRCGKPFADINFLKVNATYQLMAEKKICYSCAYWELFKYEEEMVTIGGVIYRFLPPQRLEPGMILGGGVMRYILKSDMTVKKSNDIWEVATVPLALRDKYPDTAWWVSKKFHDKWKKNCHKCIARGCLDRYHCFRYDYKREYKDGPFNAVPKDWIVGEEYCRSFLDIRDIQRYDRLFDKNDLLFSEQFSDN